MFTLSEFLNFLKRPHYPLTEPKDAPIVSTVLKIYLFIILAATFFSELTKLLIPAFVILPTDETLEIPAYLKDQHWIYFLLTGFLIPLVEETIFRLSLIFNPMNLSFSVSLIVYLLSRTYLNKLSSLLILILTLPAIYRLCLHYKELLHSVWRQYFKYIFYFSALMFGLGHSGNYRFSFTYQYFVVVLLVLPQLAMGFIVSFTRLYYKRGFLLGFLVHCITNCIPVSLMLLRHPR
jgi:membrane protease YdiL (CAAX protease family)